MQAPWRMIMNDRTFALTSSALCVVINLVLGTIVQTLSIPLIFLDTIGTIFGAVLLGPFHGVLIGLTTNVVQGAMTNPRNIPFALVNMAIGLSVGLIARRFRFDLKTALLTGLGLSVLAPLIGTPIAVWIYGGLTGGGTDFLVMWLRATGSSIFASTFIPRITGNLIDKIVSCLLVAFLIQRLPERFLDRKKTRA